MAEPVPTVQLLAAAGLPEGVQLGPTLAILGAIFLVTLALRGLPFAALRFFRESDLVTWLGLAMPVGVMTLLVIYTVSGQASAPGGLTAVGIALVFTVALHLWRRSTTLSILLGTVLYLVLVNLVF
ncbi:AzlD domain-containing protein [uncultured Corynebacterium sp.]|uniref:branched-chain amino acid transporter permease n=1 Tax=uncultured Corynebacterium sp. TaxID=159447 RepID=UPI0025EA57B5|nr:AzlD domain-containing protein [uncultured Corynebacterium sp.]